MRPWKGVNELINDVEVRLVTQDPNPQAERAEIIVYLTINDWNFLVSGILNPTSKEKISTTFFFLSLSLSLWLPSLYTFLSFFQRPLQLTYTRSS